MEKRGLPGRHVVSFYFLLERRGSAQANRSHAVVFNGRIVISGYHLAFTKKNRFILLAMVALYAAAFTVYGLLTSGNNAFITAPADTFYYRRKWCGLGGEGVQNSCKAVRYH